ncbi:MAG: DNA gyrase subunit A, partial [Clostridiales bacterium]|nr:DNA gyrase subunit A [Clostridiales bacterium]
LQMMPGEKITAVIPIKDYDEADSWYLFMATKKGLVKKTTLSEYANVRKNGLTAIVLREDDELIEVKFTDDKKDVFLITKYGQCIRFHETDVRKTGRVSMGVIGINLSEGDEVVAMQLDAQGEYLLIVSENGLGKRTRIEEFSSQKRAGKGVLCYKITEKSGCIVGAKAVSDDNEILVITTEGIIIRMKVSDISVLGRVTSGVKVISLAEDVTVASFTKVMREETSEAEELSEEEENPESENHSEE